MDRKFAISGVDAGTALGEAAPRMLRAKAEPLFRLEEAARGGADADAVHDMRVASRRLREVMRLLEPAYPGGDFRVWYRRARRITRALGPVRDSDVFIEEFSRFGTEVGAGGTRAVAFLIGYRMGQRERELEVLNAELGRLDLAGQGASFSKMADSIREAPGSDRALADFAHAAVAERAAVVFGAQPRALDEAEVAAQHALRIDYKRLRYAVEAFAPCYGEAFDEIHRTLTGFQDALGDMHDLHVFADMVRLPERVEAAARAGVTGSDIGEIEVLLAERAHERFEEFRALAAAHPAETLLPTLLLPLVRHASPVAVVAPDAQSASPDGAAPAAPVDAQPVSDDESADAALAYEDLPIASPVIVGDEPWADGWDDRLAGGGAERAVWLDPLVTTEEPVDG